MSEDLLGKQLGGYEILDIIGHGGMATVYRALQTSMNRVVALKILPRHFLRDDTYLQRFEREVKIITQLEHRNIVPVHDYGQHDQQPYIAMRYLSGGSVDNLLQQGPLHEDKALSILSQVAPALDYAHSKSVLHRDLKPSNILLDDDGGAYITDFGIARILGTEGQGMTITTQGVVGTPSYMSPEQAQAKPMDGRSDVYALGVMLFEMMTGRRPFTGDTPYSVAVMQVTAQPPFPRSINPKVSGTVEQVILKAIKKQPENRYQSAVQLAEALRLAIERPDAVHDTRPGFSHSDIPIQVTQSAAVQSPGQAASPSPRAATPPSSRPVYQHPPVSQVSHLLPAAISGRELLRPVKQRRSSFWISVIVGGLMGCGLLSAAVALGIMVVSNYLSATDVPLPTASPTGSATVISAGPPTATPVFFGATPIERTPDPGVSGTLGPADQPTPTFPPDFDATSGLILYFARTEKGNFALFELDLESGEYVQLTTDDYNASYPQMSPNGRWLAYQSDQDGDFEIFLMELATGEISQLTDNALHDRIPAWSPDSQWLIYSSDTREDGNLDLYRVGVDGAQAQLIYSDGKRSSHARFSHDGRHLVFTNGDSNDATTWEIVRLDLGTGELLRLTNNTVRDANPSFSLDDQTILFNSHGEGEAAILTMPADGSGASRILYDGVGWEWGMHYSLDGAFILFNSQVEEHSTLHLMHANGSDLRQIETDNDGYYPSWMP